jgi:hypothetical protein
VKCMASARAHPRIDGSAFVVLSRGQAWIEHRVNPSASGAFLLQGPADLLVPGGGGPNQATHATCSQGERSDLDKTSWRVWRPSQVPYRLPALTGRRGRFQPRLRTIRLMAPGYLDGML